MEFVAESGFGSVRNKQERNKSWESELGVAQYDTYKRAK